MVSTKKPPKKIKTETVVKIKKPTKASAKIKGTQTLSKVQKPTAVKGPLLVSKIQKSLKNEKIKKTILKAVIDKESETTNAKKIEYTMPSKYVSEDIVNAVLTALDQVAVSTKNKNAIFEDEQQIFLEMNCIKIQNVKGNIKFVLPHSTASSTEEICLITPDLKKGQKSDHEPTIDYWEEILRKADVKNIKTVLPMRQLRVEYDQFELKRRLLTQHDFIMVDTRVLNHVSHILGKMFFKKHNMLIPVRLNEKEKEVKKCIDIGLRTAMLRLGEGRTSVIVVGHTGMAKEHLKDNILSLLQQFKEKYPGGEQNIRSIAIKLPLSLALPLYLTLRPSNSVTHAPKIRKRKPKNFHVLEDELSTLNEGKVRVAPDGTVHVKKDKEFGKKKKIQKKLKAIKSSVKAE